MWGTIFFFRNNLESTPTVTKGLGYKKTARLVVITIDTCFPLYLHGGSIGIEHYCALNIELSLVTKRSSVAGHFVPFWSIRTHFYFQFGHFVPSLVISYQVWYFRTYF